MCGMRRDQIHPFRSYLLLLPLLVLPVVIIAGVGVFAYKAINHVDKLTFREDYSSAGDTEEARKLKECIKGKTGADNKISSSDFEACTAQTAPSTPLDQQIKTRIDELKWMLTVIGTIGGFFVIAQAGAAFFSAVTYTQQAEKALKHISDTEQEIRSRYPIFRFIEEQRSLALGELEQDVKTTSKADDPAADPTEVLDYDYRTILYPSMDLRRRQRLLSIESFASIDLHPGPLGHKSYADNLRRFAIFYQSKFHYEKSAGFGSLADLERAESYLRLSAEKSRGDFTLQNDLGVLCMSMNRLVKKTSNEAGDRFDYAKEAFTAFTRSLIIEPRQQRAYYNLAVLKAGHYEPKDYKGACEDLESALEQENWQRLPCPNAVKSFIYYNLGCYRAQLLDSDKRKIVLTPAAAKDCLDALNKAAELGGIKKKTIEDEFDAKGDLYGIYGRSDAALKARLDEAKKALLDSSAQCKAAQKPPSLRTAIQELTTAIAENWKKYWDSPGKS